MYAMYVHVCVMYECMQGTYVMYVYRYVCNISMHARYVCIQYMQIMQNMHVCVEVI